MGKLTVRGLRVVLVVVLAVSVFVQVALVAANANELDPTLETMRNPYLVVAFVVLGLVALQVIVVCMLRLLTMVRRGTAFSHAAFRYVDIVIGAIVAADLLVATLVAIQLPGEDVAPGMVLVMGGAFVAALGVALIVLVLRTLLAQAVARDAEAASLEAELGEVI